MTQNHHSHKHHKHREDRHHEHRSQKPEKKTKAKAQKEDDDDAPKDGKPKEQQQQQQKQKPQQSAAPAWSQPIMDPSGRFSYRALLLPNGQWTYDISGPQAHAFNSTSTSNAAAYQAPRYPLPYTAYQDAPTYSASSSASSYQDDHSDSDSVAAKTDGIHVERSPNGDMNIVTPANQHGRQLVVVVRANPDDEITPVKAHSSTGESSISSHGRKPGETKGPGHAFFDKTAPSKSKVLAWRDR